MKLLRQILDDIINWDTDRDYDIHEEWAYGESVMVSITHKWNMNGFWGMIYVNSNDTSLSFTVDNIPTARNAIIYTADEGQEDFSIGINRKELYNDRASKICHISNIKHRIPLDIENDCTSVDIEDETDLFQKSTIIEFDEDSLKVLSTVYEIMNEFTYYTTFRLTSDMESIKELSKLEHTNKILMVQQ